MFFQETTATRKICGLTKRVRGVAGGTSASKTISILLWLIDYAQTHESEVVSVVSETMPHLRKGAMRDFETIMRTHGYWKEESWNATNSVYTFPSGTLMEFFPATDSDKVRGPRRDVLFLNEANNVSYETYTQLEIRTRKIIWLDWNPTFEFWFYTDVMGKPEVDFLILTYQDNEALETSIIQSIESRRGNRNWWKVYGEGLLGESEGRIYTGWQIIDSIPHEARLERYGLDFGYSNDPTALVAIYRYNGGFILDEITYQKGLSNKQIADLLLMEPTAVVVADSAEPKSIDEIKSYGISILPSSKGPGSVLQGIQYLQQQRISITQRSVNGIKEYRNYLWQTDSDGKPTNEPSPIWNHFLDATRYGMNKVNPDQRQAPPPAWYSKEKDFNRAGAAPVRRDPPGWWRGRRAA